MNPYVHHMLTLLLIKLLLEKINHRGQRPKDGISFGPELSLFYIFYGFRLENLISRLYAFRRHISATQTTSYPMKVEFHCLKVCLTILGLYALKG